MPLSYCAKCAKEETPIQTLERRKGYANGNSTARQVYHGERERSTPRTFRRRIENTNYRVGVHFSRTSRETLEDKVLRMMKNEIATEGMLKSEKSIEISMV